MIDIVIIIVMFKINGGCDSQPLSHYHLSNRPIHGLFSFILHLLLPCHCQYLLCLLIFVFIISPFFEACCPTKV